MTAPQGQQKTTKERLNQTAERKDGVPQPKMDISGPLGPGTSVNISLSTPFELWRLAMSRATPDDQLKFLLTCVKHSNNGKIDFIEVAKECGIVSKGAAAKRYERLMKANGIHPNGGPAEKQFTPPSKPKERSKASIAKAAAEKRRKIEGPPSRLKDDDEDMKPMIRKPVAPIPVAPKPEPVENQPIKQEPLTRTDSGLTMPLLLSPTVAPSWRPAVVPYPFSTCSVGPPAQQQQYFVSGDHSMFDDFCDPEVFTQQTGDLSSNLTVPRSLPPSPQEVVEAHVPMRDTEPATQRQGLEREFILIMD